MFTTKPVKNSDKISVLFETDAYDEANKVTLVGDFNGWEPTRTPMKKRKDGSWSVAVRLDKGSRYEYRFVVDGSDWAPDPGADLVPNGYGGQNSVVAL